MGGRRDRASPAEEQHAPPHPHWEGGAAAPKLRMQDLDLLEREEREAPLGPFCAIMGCRCLPSSQAAPRTLGRGLGKEGIWQCSCFQGSGSSLACLSGHPRG